jgi:hypothetical protein
MRVCVHRLRSHCASPQHSVETTMYLYHWGNVTYLVIWSGRCILDFVFSCKFEGEKIVAMMAELSAVNTPSFVFELPRERELREFVCSLGCEENLA